MTATQIPDRIVVNGVHVHNYGNPDAQGYADCRHSGCASRYKTGLAHSKDA